MDKQKETQLKNPLLILNKKKKKKNQSIDLLQNNNSNISKTHNLKSSLKLEPESFIKEEDKRKKSLNSNLSLNRFNINNFNFVEKKIFNPKSVLNIIEKIKKEEESPDNFSESSSSYFINNQS